MLLAEIEGVLGKANVASVALSLLDDMDVVCSQRCLQELSTSGPIEFAAVGNVY